MFEPPTNCSGKLLTLFYLLDDPSTERERKLIRAEEQKARSARMLYMLQHKVQNVEKELGRQKTLVRPTKKVSGQAIDLNY